MSSRLGPLEITCDAPPYGVVKACEELDFLFPLDNAWFRLSHFLADKGHQGGTLADTPWHLLLGKNEIKEKTCLCREPLPTLEKYTLTFVSGKVADYRLGQCQHCLTMYWEEG